MQPAGLPAVRILLTADQNWIAAYRWCMSQQRGAAGRAAEDSEARFLLWQDCHWQSVCHAGTLGTAGPSVV